MNDGKKTPTEQVLIIPCSGMGKTYGSVGREATYVVVEDLRPNRAATLCLSLLTLQDENAQQKVREHATIAIDGCPKACAEVNVKKSGGTPAAIFRVFDVFREHKDLRGGSVLDIGDNGRKLARILAEKVAVSVDEQYGKKDWDNFLQWGSISRRDGLKNGNTQSTESIATRRDSHVVPSLVPGWRRTRTCLCSLLSYNRS